MNVWLNFYKLFLGKYHHNYFADSFNFKYQDVCGGQSCFLISNYNSSSKNGPEIVYVGYNSC